MFLFLKIDNFHAIILFLHLQFNKCLNQEFIFVLLNNFKKYILKLLINYNMINKKIIYRKNHASSPLSSSSNRFRIKN